ncbi:MAG TPA: 6-pyruvoyl-tetrahydropterin synthase-related protein, partial [Thermoanaerobaculia bacterium]|nr:6-pyruvoyl-tetrahydropterin synthase-related protein [Thermoanaerobaculia bacterium]
MPTSHMLRLLAMIRRLALLPIVLPVLTVFAVLATTSGATAIRPRVLVVAGAAVVFAALAGIGGKKPRPWLDFPLAALLGLAASHLLFSPGLPRGHDITHHLWSVWAVAQEVRAGDPAALWLHEIGLGVPVVPYYGPGIFYATLPFSLAGLNPVWAVKAASLMFSALAAMAIYFAVARWTEDRRAGLVAAAAYAFAPYRLLDAHYRSALTECVALALLPLVLYFGVSAVREGGRRRLAVASVPAALLIVTHPISALMSAIGLGVWIVAELLLERRSGLRKMPSAVARMAGVWLLGACLAGFFLIPFLAKVKYLEVGRIAQGGQRVFLFAHGLTPRELVWRRPWTALYAAGPHGDPIDGTEKEMPLYFGGVLLSLLPLAAGLGRVPRGLTPLAPSPAPPS